MNLELTLEEATKFIEGKIDSNGNLLKVNIIIPEEKNEAPSKNLQVDFRDSKTRTLLIQDVKRALSIDKMFAIRFLRYRIRSLSLSEAAHFTEMTEDEFQHFIKTAEVRGIIWDFV